MASYPLKNTYRDSNEIQSSSSTHEPMDTSSEYRQSIIQPIDTENSLLPNYVSITNKSLGKSIVRTAKNVDDDDDDDDGDEEEQPEPLYNRPLINETNSISEASGYDPSRLAEVDADAAYALQLQQEEYSRESIRPIQHPYFPFQIDQDDEPVDRDSPIPVEPPIPQFQTDEEYAAYLQQQEDRNRHQYNRHRIPFGSRRHRPNPVFAQTSQPGETENRVNPGIRFAQQPPVFNEDNDDDDDDDDSNANADAQVFLRYIAAHGNHGRGGIHPFFLPGFPGFRRGHRRSGNLQDTTDDFGPEDYERLLQLDDTIHKKKLTREQISSIQTEQFQRTSNNTDEENKCGVCLELFEENQKLRRFPCRHVYHIECADRWLQENNVCPICREPPVKVQSTSNSRYHRNIPHPKRGTTNNRNPTSRNTNNNNNKDTNHHHYNNNNNNNNNNRRGSNRHNQS